jgi:hypothetical protein
MPPGPWSSRPLRARALCGDPPHCFAPTLFLFTLCLRPDPTESCRYQAQPPRPSPRRLHPSPSAVCFVLSRSSLLLQPHFQASVDALHLSRVTALYPLLAVAQDRYRRSCYVAPSLGLRLRRHLASSRADVLLPLLPRCLRFRSGEALHVKLWERGRGRRVGRLSQGPPVRAGRRGLPQTHGRHWLSPSRRARRVRPSRAC